MNKHKVPPSCSRADDCARSLNGRRDDEGLGGLAQVTFRVRKERRTGSLEARGRLRSRIHFLPRCRSGEAAAMAAVNTALWDRGLALAVRLAMNVSTMCPGSMSTICPVRTRKPHRQ